MGDVMTFPASVEEFMEQYKMTDTEQVYSNGTEYVPIYRMRQWFENCRNQQRQTIYAVQVVRCKDCIRRYDTDECPMCYLSEGKYYEYTNGNGYCDRGERKEGADNGR